MSKSLLLSAKPAKARMEKLLNECLHIEQPSSQLSNEEQVSLLTVQKRKINEKLKKLSSTSKTLTEVNHQWLNLIKGSVGRQHLEDERLYEEEAVKEDGIIWILERGKEEIENLELMSDEIEDSLKKLTPSNLVHDDCTNKTFSETNSESICQIKLPRLELKAFDGEIEHWAEFWSGFEAAVDRQNIPNIQKLNYLLSCLKGKAAVAAQGYLVSPENYDIVKETLCRRFGDKSVLLRTLYAGLKGIKKTHDLRNTVGEIERILRQLEAQGENVEHTHIEMTIEEKLPKWVVEKVYEAKDSDPNWNIYKLRKLLEQITRRKEDINRIFDPEDKKESYKSYKRNEFLKRSDDRTSAFPALVNRQRAVNAPVKRCILCDNSHWVRDCDEYDTVEKRVVRAKGLGLCFKCLVKGHRMKECPKKVQCYRCQNNHHVIFCNSGSRENKDNVGLPIQKPKPIGNRSLEAVENEQKPKIVMVSTSFQRKLNHTKVRGMTTILLLCKEVSVTNPDDPLKKEKVTVFFDVGSQRSFISEDIVDRLGLKRERSEALSILGFAARKPEAFKTHNVTFSMLLTNGETAKINANTMAFLTKRLQIAKVNEENMQHFYEENRNALNVPTVWQEPKVIIGSDYYFDFIKSSQKLNSGFHLIDSTVGIMIAGRGEAYNKNRQSSTVAIHTTLVDDLERFWNLELVGIQESPIEDDDSKALEYFGKTIRRKEDGRYSVSWPWNTPEPRINTHFGLCFGRLKTTFRRLNEDPDLLTTYNQLINDQKGMEIIEEVNPNELPKGVVHYIPHHAVITPQKITTKVRIVFDASAKLSNGKSLNDLMYRGPVMLPNLCGILLRFRFMKRVIMGDVEKAFHQLELNEADRDCARFLWLKDITKPVSEDNLVIYRFRRIPFGVVASPFLLAATLQYHLRSSGTKTALKVLKNLYVDNVILEADTNDEVTTIYQELKQLFSEAKMNIREFYVNDNEAYESIPVDDRQHFVEERKVLGINWNAGEETLVFVVRPCEEKILTKRQVLQYLASIYDPLGFMVPIVLPLKLYMQDMWKRNYAWDEPVSNEHLLKWKDLMKTYKQMSIRIPRYLIKNGALQLHVFVDASSKAYAAALYLSSEQSGKREIHLIYAKSRLCPLKGLTIPRLELLAVLIGVRAMNFVVTEVELEGVEKYIWSDSKCVLHWIRDETKVQPLFIKNRLDEIRKSPAIFKYVPTNDNVADIATRGVTPEELLSNYMWWNGPIWLKEETRWPTWDPDDSIQESVDLEETFSEGIVTMKIECDSKPYWIDTMRYSNWNRMVGAVGYTLRFIKRVSKDKFNWLRQVSTTGPLTADDCKIAVRFILLQEQKVGITDEEKRKWDLYVDVDELLRCGGRLSNAVVTPTAIHPIYLPRRSRATELLILKIHVENAHIGVAQTLSEVRQDYWVPKGISTVKRVIQKCMLCRRWKAKQFALPPFPSYPANRVQRTRVFQSVGLDYLGPVNVKGLDESRKCWICLFTCFSTRAVHLELIKDLTAVAFLHGFRRFVARRGMPEEVLSDNAPQFKLSEKAINEVIDRQSEIKDYCGRKGIKWSYITARAPWQGGMYERLVGLTKNAIRRSVGRKFLNYEEWQTLIVEVEGILNSRPLTVVSSSTTEVLRPIDFMIPKANIGSVISSINDLDDQEYLPTTSARQNLINQWENTSRCLNYFWILWNKMYLLNLRERTQKEHRQGRCLTHRCPRMNEIVIIYEEDIPRGLWKLGKIVDLKLRSDNMIKSATVQLPNGNLWTRPISYLAPLEVSDTDETEESSDNQTSDRT